MVGTSVVKELKKFVKIYISQAQKFKGSRFNETFVEMQYW